MTNKNSKKAQTIFDESNNKTKNTENTRKKPVKKEKTPSKINKKPNIISKTIKNIKAAFTKRKKIILRFFKNTNKKIKKIRINDCTFFKITTILLAILALILSICLFKSKSDHKYDVSSILSTYDGKNATLTLPNEYRLSNEGIIYYVDDDNIKALCTMNCVEASEEDFNNAVIYYKENFDFEDVESINGFKIGKLMSNQNGIDYTYYLLFKDGLFNELVFVDADENAINTIIKSFNY